MSSVQYRKAQKIIGGVRTMSGHDLCRAALQHILLLCLHSPHDAEVLRGQVLLTAEAALSRQMERERRAKRMRRSVDHRASASAAPAIGHPAADGAAAALPA